MKINEITTSLKTFVATVRLNGISIKTSITAENLAHARLLLQKLYGNGNISSLGEESIDLEEAVEGTKVLSSAELQVKSLSDQETRIKQQKKQLQAKQALAKAQEKMRDAVNPVV